VFNRKKLQREKESLEAELTEAHATIRRLRKQLRTRRKRLERIKTSSTLSQHHLRVSYIVHDERKFVYMWIQKVACTSVKTALSPLFDLDPTHDGTRHPMGHGFFNASEDYRITKELLLAGLDQKYKDYFKFAFVRNPWDRLVSCYVDKIVRNEVPPKLLRSAGRADVEFYPKMPFAEFVETVCRIPDRVANPHFRPQHLTVCGPNGKPMADFVGRFENLREDFARVAQEIGAPELELPERNRKFASEERGSRPYHDFYDARLRDMVYRRYEKDVETFGYTF
jgi:hypothetical protein